MELEGPYLAGQGCQMRKERRSQPDVTNVQVHNRIAFQWIGQSSSQFVRSQQLIKRKSGQTKEMLRMP